MKWFENGAASLSLSSYCHMGSQLCNKGPVIIPVGSACLLISSGASKIAPSERGDAGCSVVTCVSIQSKEWVCEIGGKRGNQSSCQNHELLSASFKEQCSFAEISFKLPEPGLGCFYF